MIPYPQMEQIDNTDLQKLRELAYRAAHKGCRFIEIGSWLGQSAEVLASVAKEYNGFLICIDNFKGNQGTILDSYASENDVRKQFIANMESLGLMSNIVLMPMDSDKALQCLETSFFDLVFIDGDHRYDQVSSDIVNSKIVIADDGIICGHDYEVGYSPDILEIGKDVDTYNGFHCGVIKAVNELVKNKVILGSRIWASYEN